MKRLGFSEAQADDEVNDDVRAFCMKVRAFELARREKTGFEHEMLKPW